jgi:hypothetical protein
LCSRVGEARRCSARVSGRVMERLGLGPEKLLAENPKLVYGRMTGWGQTGPQPRGQADINYITDRALNAIGQQRPRCRHQFAGLRRRIVVPGDGRFGGSFGRPPIGPWAICRMRDLRRRGFDAITVPHAHGSRAMEQSAQRKPVRRRRALLHDL